jgi:hypothetical protein
MKQRRSKRVRQSNSKSKKKASSDIRDNDNDNDNEALVIEQLSSYPDFYYLFLLVGSLEGFAPGFSLG